MKKSTQLLQSLKQRLLEESRSNSGFIEVPADELMALREVTGQGAPEAAGPPPGAFDRVEDQPEIYSEETAPQAGEQPAEQRADPLGNVDGRLTPEEMELLHHPDLLLILAESPSELPPRVLARAERLSEDRAPEAPSPWSWINQH